MKAVLHYRAGPQLRARVAALAVDGVSVAVVDEGDQAGFMRAIADADVLLHVLEPVTAEMIAAAPRLRLIQKIGVGVNTIDQAAAARRGVAVANMPGANSQAVAEQTLALMLALLRRVTVLDMATRRGEGWRLPPERLEQGGEIGGRVIGFVGYGAVPRRLTPALRALGARIHFVSRSVADQPDSIERRDLRSLLRESDIVSLHVPLTEETRFLIDAEALSRMKSSALLINTARGELVNEPALIEALTHGRLSGAGLDVFAEEPPRADNPLFALPNVVVSPHVAWLTPETLERSLAVALENCRRLREGAPLLNQVAWTPPAEAQSRPEVA